MKASWNREPAAVIITIVTITITIIATTATATAIIVITMIANIARVAATAVGRAMTRRNVSPLHRGEMLPQRKGRIHPYHRLLDLPICGHSQDAYLRP